MTEVNIEIYNQAINLHNAMVKGARLSKQIAELHAEAEALFQVELNLKKKVLPNLLPNFEEGDTLVIEGVGTLTKKIDDGNKVSFVTKQLGYCGDTYYA